MARTVPATIDEALHAVSASPAAVVTIADAYDRPGTAITNANAGRSAILSLPSGTYLRAYVDQPALGTAAQVYSQLVTDMSDAVQWNTYDLRSAGAEGQAGVALILLGGSIFVFYQRLSDHALCYQTSLDGTAWSTEAIAASPGDRVWAMAAASDGTDIDLFAACNHSPGNDDYQDIAVYQFDGTTWTGPSMWSNDYRQIRGLAAVFQDGAYRLILGGQRTRAFGGLSLCRTTLSGSTWDGVDPIHQIDDVSTGLSIPYPSLVYDPVADRYLCAATVYDDGSASGAAGQRTELWTSPGFVHWHLDNYITSTAFTNGCAVTTGPDAGYLLADAGTALPSESAAGTSSAEIELSADIISLSMHEAANSAGRAEIILSNESGQYTRPATPTDAVRVGAVVRVELGYDGVTVPTHKLYVDQIETRHNLGLGVAGETVRLRCSSRVRLLERRVTVDRTQTQRDLAFLINHVAISGGLPNQAAIPADSQFTNVLDSFAVNSQGTYLEALRRLQDVFGFEWFLDETETLQVRQADPADASSYSYGTAGVETNGYQTGFTRQPNAGHVVGNAQAGSPPAFAFTVDDIETAASGEVFRRNTVDRLLITSDAAALRAGLELQRDKRRKTAATVALPLNPCHQPLDVITIDDEYTSAVSFRIQALDWTVDFGRSLFGLTALVEAV